MLIAHENGNSRCCTYGHSAASLVHQGISLGAFRLLIVSCLFMQLFSVQMYGHFVFRVRMNIASAYSTHSLSTEALEMAVSAIRLRRSHQLRWHLSSTLARDIPERPSTFVSSIWFGSMRIWLPQRMLPYQQQLLRVYAFLRVRHRTNHDMPHVVVSR